MRIFLTFLLALFLMSNSFAAIDKTEGSVPPEYIETAETIVESFRTRAGTKIADLLDLETILNTSVEGMKLSATTKQEVLTGFLQAKGDIAQGITALIPEGSLVKLLHSKPHSEGAQALVRLDLGDQGYSYRNFILSKDKKGEVMIVDWFDYTTGQTYTDTIRQSLIAMLPGESKYSRLFDMVRGKDKARKQSLEMLQAVSRHDHETFFSIFEVVDEAARHSRLILVMAFSMANVSGDMQRYSDVLNLLDEHHGDDESLQFLLFDHYFMHGKYDRAIAALHATANDMGTRDAVNYSLAAVVYNQAGDIAKAIEAGEKAIAMEPDVELGYWALLTSYANTKQFAEAVAAAKQLENQFDAAPDYEALKEDPVFKYMVESEEFKKWKNGD